MPSQLDELTPAENRGRGAAATFVVWNRRVHYFLGLYLLFFCWLFALTGLLLNHPRWEFAQFWPNRVRTTSEHALRVPSGSSDMERARDVMRQLGVAGEIQWPPTQSTNGSFAFQVTRPGVVIEVNADSAWRATVHRTALNVWGVAHLLHTFTGMPATDARHTRDWTLTRIWAFSMDAVAAGLIVMVFSSYIMWYQMRPKRRGGFLALSIGFLTCAAFVAGFPWLL
jgi:hypothetical protein